MAVAGAISEATLAVLHSTAEQDPDAIREICRQLCDEGVELRQGTDARARPEQVWVVGLTTDGLRLRSHHLRARPGEGLFLNFELDGLPHFFATEVAQTSTGRELVAAWPAVIYRVDRRERMRRPESGRRARLVDVRQPAAPREAELVERSPDGLAVDLPEEEGIDPGRLMRVETDSQPGRALLAEVRNRRPHPRRAGWTRLGLAVLPGEPQRDLRVERLPLSEPGLSPRRAKSAVTGSRRIEFLDDRGESIAALLDEWSDAEGDGTAVVIPPAWGKTKETLLPLARTLVETFARAGEPIAVLRFDGIRRRGESHIDPENRAPGRENLAYTFSQGTRDIRTALRFVRSLPRWARARCVLLSMSVASIEARRALAEDREGLVAGWVSAVGATDPQSLLRVISGGIDYMGGGERGLRFGVQDVQGILVDMDVTTADALETRVAFLDDARRDLAGIRVPVTWIHGRDDAWCDLARVRDALSFAPREAIRLIELPVGHQLRDSHEARSVFGLIASEVARISLGRPLAPVGPDAAELRERRRAERRAPRREDADLESFWRSYLVGREGDLGIELVASTHAYRELLDAQIDALGLAPGATALDLGSGTGVLALRLAERAPHDGLRVIALDLVREALRRGRQRLAGRQGAPRLESVVVNLDPPAAQVAIPLADGAADAALLSLLINYVSAPEAVLAEVARVLRPGGRLVLSSLRPDADVSRICVRTVEELRSGLSRAAFGEAAERRLQRSLHGFINDAGKLLTFEELGLFRFWDESALAGMLEAAGFRVRRLSRGYGDPPQAILVEAETRE